MSELDLDARTLLDLGRDRLGPDAETVARLRGRIETAAAVAGGATIAGSLASKLGLTGVKLALLATVTTVSTVAAVEVVQHARHREAPTALIVPGPTVAKRTVAPRQNIVVQPIVDEPGTFQQPAPIVDQPAPRPKQIANKPAPQIAVDQPAPAPKRATLARETELVDLATRAMRDSDLAALHATIELYESETGGAGQLAEDIAAIEIEALCRANDPSATTRLAAFDARWPRAGQRHRLTAACKGAP
jgi:hypothetical protein